MSGTVWSGKSAFRFVLLLFYFCFFSNSAFAQTVVTVRSGDHDGFSRLVFDWPEKVAYRINRTEERLEITFDRAQNPDWGRLLRDPLVYLSDPQHRIADGQLIVSLKLAGPVVVKDFRYETKTVFDVRPAASQTGRTVLPDAEEETEAESAGDQTVLRKKAVEPIVEKANSGNGFGVVVSREGDRLRLHYPWAEAATAAVAFVRHNHLWVVFDRKKTVTHEALAPFIGQQIVAAEQLDHPAMTLLRYQLAGPAFVASRREGTAWVIDLEPEPQALRWPIVGSHQRLAGNRGENFFFAVENSGPVVVVDDPAIGDRLAIVPVLRESEGVAAEKKFAEFTVLVTGQGIAVQLMADDLSLDRHSNGVSVGRPGGLALSRSQLSQVLGAGGLEEEAENRRLIDFSRWAMGPLPDQDYYSNKHELLYQLSNATDSSRNEIRWTLARFYLANGRYRAAYGVLQVMQDKDPNLQENPEFRVALGVTDILMGRFADGVKMLDHKSLLADKDIFLWRALAHGRLGHSEQAFEDYQQGAGILDLYDLDRRFAFIMTAIRAAYALGDTTFVATQIDSLASLPLNVAQLTTVDYWKARLARDQGDMEQATVLLNAVTRSGVRRIAAQAAFDLVDMALENGTLENRDAIDQLEKLRFAWRGDDFELDLLSRLGDLYVAENEFSTGLQTLKLAVTFFNGTAKTAALTQQMSRIYSDLFLKGGADVMEPIKAVALYSEFRELIPLGNAGDDMTRRLADRLVSLDLLEEAGNLLNHQVKFRLKGGAQAVVASRLAMIYLLDSKPDKALEILRATRDSQIPADIALRRKMIEIRTLIELGRYEEAEVMLEGHNSPEAEEMRSDIYWKSENWANYITHGKKMLADRYQDPADLSPSVRLAVLRLSAAYVINGDKAGLSTLRQHYKAHMENGLYGDTFEVITAERQLTDVNIRRLTRSIASVAKLENFMTSYKAEFASPVVSNNTENSAL